MRGLVILRISLVLVSVVGVIRSSTSTSTRNTLDDDEGPSVRRVEGSSKVIVMTHSREGRGGDVAWGTFVDSSEKKSNFGVLEVHTSGEYGDEEQMFAAGFLEGYVTAKRISENFRNLHAYFTGTMNASLDAPMDWIHTQDDWMRTMCNEHTGMGMTPGRWKGHVSAGRNKRRKRRERFWMAVCLSVRQFDGLISGYQHAAKENQELPPMGYSDFLFLESNGDLYDVIDSMDPSQRPHWNISNKAIIPERHCSFREMLCSGQAGSRFVRHLHGAFHMGLVHGHAQNLQTLYFQFDGITASSSAHVLFILSRGSI